MACGGGLVERFRVTENLITFEEMERKMLEESEVLEKEGIIDQGTAQRHFTRKMFNLLLDTILYLGAPRKEEVEFYTVPQNIVDNLRWAPKK